MNYTVQSLLPDTSYYFTIKSIDEFDNLSDVDVKTNALSQAYAVSSVDNIAPSNVNNLNALTGSGVGNIQLSWTGTGDDNSIGNITGGEYRIKWSTTSEADWNSGSWNDWDNRYVHEFSTNVIQGTGQSTVITSLIDYTTYYFRVWTADDRGNWSTISNAAAARTQQNAINTITDLIASSGLDDREIDLQWTSVGGKEYVMKYSTCSLSDLSNDTTAWWNSADTYLLGWSPKAIGTIEQVTIAAGLIPATTYYIAIKSTSGVVSSDISNIEEVKAGDKVPAAPQGITLTFIENKVSVNWTANSEPDINYYTIYRKAEGGSYALLASTTATQYDDTNIEQGKKYYYYLTVTDNTDNTSLNSDEKEIFTGDITIYPDVEYIRVLTVENNSITMSWPQVNASVKGYAVERAEDIAASEWTEVSFVYSTNTLQYVIQRENKVYHYRLVTVSQGGSRSNGSMSIDTSDDVNRSIANSDRSAIAMLPYYCYEELMPENNGGQFVSVSVETEASSDGFLKNYNIKATKAGVEVEDFRFNNTRKGIKIVFSYSQMMQSRAFADALSANQQLVIYWFNGVEWVKLGGISDSTSANIYTFSRRIGQYALKLDTLADEFTLNWVKPRIFTPEESGGVINEVRFGFENPNFAEVTIKIYDISGAEIRTTLRREGENVMVWDGRDNSGSIVRAGMYIYQIEADGKVLNGTVVVAK
jgi:hypothetical protein